MTKKHATLDELAQMVARGFEATATHSVHYLPHPGFAKAVADFLARERDYVDAVIAGLQERSALKP